MTFWPATGHYIPEFLVRQFVMPDFSAVLGFTGLFTLLG